MPLVSDPNERLAKPELSNLPRFRVLTTVDFPPFSFVDQTGRLSGFHVDLVREICRELAIEAKCQIQVAPFADLQKALDEGIPVVGYDRLIENPKAFYITFDNKEVGRLQAKEVFKAKPEGNYVFIKGSSSNPNADFLFGGQMEVLKAAIDSGKIKNVGEAYTDGWKPENAQKNMEQFLTKNNNKVDAVVASNDGTAGGAIAALTAQGLAGSVPVSGQDGDAAALNRVALGTQTVSVWKDARELGKNAAEIAVALADGKKMDEIKGVQTFSGGPKKVPMKSVFLTPMAITKDNLNVVIDAGWITKAAACQGVKAGTVKACN